MNCPRCNEFKLMMTSREGVEIDYCPQCRGVWLDRGELDKILERSDTQQRAIEAQAVSAARGFDDRPRYRDDDDDDDHRRRYRDDDDDDWKLGKKRKRKGFLSEIFDF